MPGLQIERREQPTVPVWLWISGALLLVALLWWAFAGMNNRPGACVVETPAATGEVAQNALPAAAILEAPEIYFGQSVSGVADVAEVNSDRGFTVETGGQKMYAILDDAIPEFPPNVNAGQTVQLQAMVRDLARLDELPVKKLVADARQSIEGQKAFLHVQNVKILSRPQE